MVKRRESSTVQQNASKKAKQQQQQQQQQIPFYKVIKNKLSNVVEDKASLETIQSIVIAVHHLSIYTLDFLKAYLLYKYDQHRALPVIDENLIKTIMTVLCEKTDKDKRSRASGLKKKRQQFLKPA